MTTLETAVYQTSDEQSCCFVDRNLLLFCRSRCRRRRRCLSSLLPVNDHKITASCLTNINLVPRSPTARQKQSEIWVRD